MASRVAKVLVDDVGSAVEVLFMTPAQIVPLIWTVGVGISMLLLRAFLIEICPFMADNSVAVAVFVDAITFRLAYLWRKLAATMEIVSLATGHGDLVSQWVEFIDPSDIKQFFTNVPIECAPYDNINSIMTGIFQSFAGSAVCPVLRYVYPVQPLFDTSNFLFGWMSFDPDPLGNNCKPFEPEELPGCFVLGLGYVIIEVLVPIILIALLLPLIKSLVKTVWVVLVVSVTFVFTAFAQVKKLLTI